MLLIFSLFIICCGNKSHNNNTNIDDSIHANKIDSVKTSKVALIDSLKDPHGFYYLTDLPLQKVADLILKDSVQPSDNKVTFDCMDSISSNNIETREFFMPVFLKIIDKADGALAEAVGGYTMAYTNKFPKEFADGYKKMTKKQSEIWISYTAEELYYNDSEGFKNSRRWTDSIIIKCTDCDSTELQVLKQFNKLILTSVKEINKNPY
jgi:hypothetical protein